MPNVVRIKQSNKNYDVLPYLEGKTLILDMNITDVSTLSEGTYGLNITNSCRGYSFSDIDTFELNIEALTDTNTGIFQGTTIFPGSINFGGNTNCVLPLTQLKIDILTDTNTISGSVMFTLYFVNINGDGFFIKTIDDSGLLSGAHIRLYKLNALDSEQ